MIGTAVDDLRALTVRQPHASAIVLGHKDVENRIWRFPLPLGTTIALHAGFKFDPAGLQITGVAMPDEPPRGVIIGLVDVVACIEDSSSPWAVPGRWHWVLANSYQLPEPIPCRGREKLWRPPPDVVERIVLAARHR